MTLHFHPYVRVMSRLPKDLLSETLRPQYHKQPQSLWQKRGLLDTADHDQRFIDKLYAALDGLLTERKELLKCFDGLISQADAIRHVIHNLVRAALFERFWSDLKRPYYQVWPVVYESGGLLKNIRLESLRWAEIPIRFSPIVLRFPAGREPFGIKSLTIQRNRFVDEATLRLFSRTHETMPVGSYGPTDMFDPSSGATAEGGGLGSFVIDVNGKSEVFTADELAEEGPRTVPLRATMAEQEWKELVEANRIRSALDKEYFANHRAVHNETRLSTCSVLPTMMHALGQQCLVSSAMSPLEGEVQWVKDAGASYLATRYIVRKAGNKDTVDSCIANTLLRREAVATHGNTHSAVQEIDAGKRGAYLSYSGPWPEKPTQELDVFILRIAAMVSLLDQGNDLITPVLLEADKDAYANASDSQRRFFEERAARKHGAVGWNLAGGSWHEDYEKGLRSPHYVMPFLRLQPHGPGSQLRKIITVRGHFRGVNHLTEVPTGFEGPEQPAAVKARFRPSIPSRVRFRIMRRDSYTCQLCGKKREDGVQLEVDHKVPVAKDGPTEERNLWVLCDVCNNGKSDLPLGKTP